MNRTYIESGHTVTVTSHPLLQRGRPAREQEVHAIAGHREVFGNAIDVVRFLANRVCTHPEAEVTA